MVWGGIALVIVLVWGASFGFWDCFSDLGLVVVSSSGVGTVEGWVFAVWVLWAF